MAPSPGYLTALFSDWLSIKIGLKLHNKSTWTDHVIDLIMTFSSFEFQTFEENGRAFSVLSYGKILQRNFTSLSPWRGAFRGGAS